jgi:hypothetical protein
MLTLLDNRPGKELLSYLAICGHFQWLQIYIKKDVTNMMNNKTIE